MGSDPFLADMPGDHEPGTSAGRPSTINASSINRFMGSDPFLLVPAR
jgi:hypothetical protein